MYELFLNSYTCEDIAMLNEGQFPLGAVIDARIEYGWDQRKNDYLSQVFENIEKRVLLTKTFSINYVSDMMAVHHKLFGDKIKQFLQEGDPAILEGLNIKGLKDYKELVTMLSTLTNPQSGVKIAPGNKVQVAGKVEHVHSVEKVEEKTLERQLPKSIDLLKEIEEAELVDE